MFRTAPDLGWVLQREQQDDAKKLSRAAMETLAIIAYHQPATRAEIEDIRGVALSKGTMDVLLETGWVRLRGRRRAPGRPVTYGTTDKFLLHFGLEQISDLPGLDELKAAGLFDGRLPQGLWRAAAARRRRAAGGRGAARRRAAQRGLRLRPARGIDRRASRGAERADARRGRIRRRARQLLVEDVSPAGMRSRMAASGREKA